MKKLFLALLSTGLFATAVFADNDTPIQVTQLPDAAQQFIKKHFSDVQVANGMMDNGMMKSYEVTFVNGAAVDFNGKGEWTEVKNPNGTVPDEIVPKPIKEYVGKTYPEQKIIGIERERNGYEIWLDNKLDLKFDQKFKLIGMDD